MGSCILEKGGVILRMSVSPRRGAQCCWKRGDFENDCMFMSVLSHRAGRGCIFHVDPLAQGASRLHVPIDPVTQGGSRLHVHVDPFAQGGSRLHVHVDPLAQGGSRLHVHVDPLAQGGSRLHCHVDPLAQGGSTPTTSRRGAQCN